MQTFDASHYDFQLEDLEEHKWDSDSDNDSTKWTDLPLLKHGSLTALEVEEQEDGNWIQRIRAR